MNFCSFKCKHADTEQSQYAACLAFNGVYCKILGKVVQKGQLCLVDPKDLFSENEKESAS